MYQFGQVTLVLSLGSLVSIGTDLGIPLALSKVACDHPELDHDAVWRAVLTRVIAGLIAGVVLVALWANTGQAERWWLAGLYSISVIVHPGRRLVPGDAAWTGDRRSSRPSITWCPRSPSSPSGVATLAAGWRPSGVIGAFVLVDVVSSLAPARRGRARD